MKTEDWEQIVDADYTPLEGARLFARLLRDGESLATIAEKFGRAPRTIENKARIANSRRLSIEAKAIWNFGDVSLEFILRLLGKAHRGMSSEEQIRLVHQEVKEVVRRRLERGAERNPRVLRTAVAVAKAQREGKRASRVRHPKELSPALPKKVVAQPTPIADLPVPPRLVLGCIDALDIMALMQVATDLNPYQFPPAQSMNGTNLGLPERWLLWLMHHYHRVVRARALTLLPPPKTGAEARALIASMLGKRDRPSYEVVSFELIRAVDRIMASRRTDREKRMLVAELERNQGEWSKARAAKDGERDNHGPEDDPKPKAKSGGRNVARYTKLYR